MVLYKRKMPCSKKRAWASSAFLEHPGGANCELKAFGRETRCASISRQARTRDGMSPAWWYEYLEHSIFKLRKARREAFPIGTATTFSAPMVMDFQSWPNMESEQVRHKARIASQSALDLLGLNAEVSRAT